MSETRIAQRLRHSFDNSMSKGAISRQPAVSSLLVGLNLREAREIYRDWRQLSAAADGDHGLHRPLAR